MNRNRYQVKAASATVVALGILTAVVLFAAVAIPARAQTVTTLYNFGATGDPTLTSGTMAQGRDGEFYGVSQSNVIYKISSTGAVTVLHTLVTAEGTICNGLTLSTDGNFYGTCQNGGTGSFGTLFKVTPTGTLTVLHSWSGATDGCNPLAPPIQGSDGNFYGTTSFCGGNELGRVYKSTPAGAYTSLYSFLGGTTDTAAPLGLIQGSDGNFWGLGNGSVFGNGGVFKITPAGKETLVYTFKGGTDGANPYDNLIQGSDGNYYGTTEGNGGSDVGTVFKLTAKGVETVLYDFPSPPTMGAYPKLPLTQGPDGLLYGIATDCSGGGCGQAGLFDITTKGVYTNLYLYPIIGGTNNEVPLSPLLLSTNGTFYSVTEQGGTHQNGSFYSVSTTYSPFVSLVSASGIQTAKVGILGQGFSVASVVKFNGVTATTVARTGTTFLLATVPAGASTGNVTVTTGATTLTSNKAFKVRPTISSFAPPSGPVGTSVIINGTGLTQTTKVTFNGTSATFTVNSDIKITATVPTSATTGKIQVTTKGGAINSATSFTVN